MMDIHEKKMVSDIPCRRQEFDLFTTMSKGTYSANSSRTTAQIVA